MGSVPAGCRLVLRTPDGAISLRSLREVALTSGWSIPVLASASYLGSGSGTLELTTQDGVIILEAHLRLTAGQLCVEPGATSADEEPVPQQRRDDVRGGVELPLRGAPVDALSRDALTEVQLEGSTVTISAGGLSATLSESLQAPMGSRLYLELELPDGQLVPAVVSVIELSDGKLRARFVDIAPIDRERIVRLVFDDQRRLLAGRRRARDLGV